MLFPRSFSPLLTLTWFSCLLLGCTNVISVDSQSHVAVASPVLIAPQSLPITATLKVGEEVIELEVAKTPEQQEIGLMARTELPENRGMVFPFVPPRITRFWMKNTLIPLDMIFVYQGRIQSIIANVPPCKSDPCPVYGPFVNIDQVIELTAGRAQSLNLKEGDRLEVNFLKQAP